MRAIAARGCLLLALLFSVNGCFLAPAIDSFKKAGVTEGDRQRLLDQQVKKFQEARYWSDSSRALSYVVPESKPTIGPHLKKGGKDERVVESAVEDVSFSESAYRAEVDVRIRSYRAPFFVVTDRIEHQVWRFSVMDGWLLETASLKVGDEQT